MTLPSTPCRPLRNAAVSLAALLLAVLLAQPALAVPRPQVNPSAAADQYVEQLSNAEAFLAEVDQTLQLALAGEYGRIKGSDVSRLQDAHQQIHGLLAGHEHPRQLGTEQRLALFNAQETIRAIVRNDEKGRRVCIRVTGTGTRVAKAECMTVAQREARARQVRESGWHLQQFREPPCERRPTSTVAVGAC